MRPRPQALSTRRSRNGFQVLWSANGTERWERRRNQLFMLRRWMLSQAHHPMPHINEHGISCDTELEPLDQRHIIRFSSSRRPGKARMISPAGTLRAHLIRLALIVGELWLQTHSGGQHSDELSVLLIIAEIAVQANQRPPFDSQVTGPTANVESILALGSARNEISACSYNAITDNAYYRPLFCDQSIVLQDTVVYGMGKSGNRTAAVCCLGLVRTRRRQQHTRISSQISAMPSSFHLAQTQRQPIGSQSWCFFATFSDLEHRPIFYGTFTLQCSNAHTARSIQQLITLRYALVQNLFHLSKNSAMATKDISIVFFYGGDSWEEARCCLSCKV